jgi:DNA-binding transcriptional LysR family regulator
MKISGIDANLVVALDALLRECNVTRAAKRLGVSQPALSHSLARLREHFKDPLLIANGRQLVLTERAAQLVEPVAAATAALGTVFAKRPAADLRRHRSFVMSCADLFADWLVPPLVRTLHADAPGIDLEVRAHAGRSTEVILSDGVELAFGVFEDVPPAFNQRYLFRDSFVCVVRANHPRVGAALSLKTYVQLQHLEVLPSPNARPGVRIERLLAARGLRRKVAVRVPYFSLAARIVATDDCVLTMTRLFAEQLQRIAPIRIVTCPLPLEPLAFSQIWPRRHDDDLVHRHVRDTSARLCDVDDRNH